jgi:hypothetical protein
MTDDIEEVPPRTLMDSMNDLDRSAEEIKEWATDMNDHSLYLYSKQIDSISRLIHQYTKILKAQGVSNWVIDFEDE